MTITNAPYRFTYVHAECFVGGLNSSDVYLTEGPDGTECSNCGNSASFCEDCYNTNYEDGQNEAMNACDYCGDNEVDVYCRQHAADNFGFTDMECDRCGATADLHLCDEHIETHNEEVLNDANRDRVTAAMAASPYEAEWDD